MDYGQLRDVTRLVHESAIEALERELRARELPSGAKACSIVLSTDGAFTVQTSLNVTEMIGVLSRALREFERASDRFSEPDPFPRGGMGRTTAASGGWVGGGGDSSRSGSSAGGSSSNQG